MAASNFGSPAPGPGMDLLVRNWWAVALRGLFAVLFGIAAIFFTPITIVSLVLVFGAYMLVDGIFAIVSGVRAAERHERWGMFVFEGLIDFAAAAAAFLVPGVALVVLIYVMGAWALVTGVMMAWAGNRARQGRGWLIAAGVISAVWGIALFVAPIAGAFVLTWFIGGYALFFGIALLILAFRLRGHHVAGA